MIELVAVAGAITTAAFAALSLWARARKLQAELSRIRVQRAFDWVITGRPPGDLAPRTPEERRAAFFVIKGGGLAVLGSLLGPRAAQALKHAREHPALTTASLTAATAICLIVVISAVHPGQDPHAARVPPRMTISLPPSPTALPSAPTSEPISRTPSGRQPGPAPDTPRPSLTPGGGPHAPVTTSEATPALSATPRPSTSSPAPGGTPTPTPSVTGPPARHTPPTPLRGCLLHAGLGQVVQAGLCLPAPTPSP